MKTLVVDDRDCSFANQSVDTISVLSRFFNDSAAFCDFVIATEHECAQGAEAFETATYDEEKKAIRQTLEFFLAALWSSNGGRLPAIPSENFDAQVETMGRKDYSYSELVRYFDGNASYHFMAGLTDRLESLNLYSQCRLLLIMRIVVKQVKNIGQ